VKGLLKAAVSQLHMSARAYHRTRSVTLRVTRTIADLASSEAIQLARPWQAWPTAFGQSRAHRVDRTGVAEANWECNKLAAGGNSLVSQFAAVGQGTRKWQAGPRAGLATP
jgi:hypothetical protein